MNNPSYFDAVHTLVGGQITGPTNGPVSGYKFLDEQTPPTESAIQTKLKDLKNTYDAKQYQRDRIYPPIGDQLDEIYHKGIEEWKKTIKAVKDKYPKP